MVKTCSREGRAPLFVHPVLLVMAATSLYAVEIDLTPSSANFQASVDAAPEGTTFRFSPGVYRNFSVEPRMGDIFQGVPGVLLNGSTALAFRQWKPGVWVADVDSLPA